MRSIRNTFVYVAGMALAMFICSLFSGCCTVSPNQAEQQARQEERSAMDVEGGNQNGNVVLASETTLGPTNWSPNNNSQELSEAGKQTVYENVTTDELIRRIALNEITAHNAIRDIERRIEKLEGRNVNPVEKSDDFSKPWIEASWIVVVLITVGGICFALGNLLGISVGRRKINGG